MTAAAAASPLRFQDLTVRPTGAARHAGRVFSCGVGRSGFSQRKVEGDGATPVGTFHLEQVFYRPDRMARPATILPCQPIRHWYGWSDAPDDPAYNQLIRRPHPFSHELLRRSDPLYDIIVVFSANRRLVIPGNGSALFLHCWRKTRHPTAGCLSFERKDLLTILRHWRPEARLVLRFGG